MAHDVLVTYVMGSHFDSPSTLKSLPQSNYPEMSLPFYLPMKIQLIMNFYQKCAILLLILVQIRHIWTLLLIVLNM